MEMMQWDDVRYFLALSRQGTLSGAARALKVEHSTVARRVTNLEQVLKVKLFDRLARGWVLTVEGQELVKKAELLEEEMMALWRAALGSAALAGPVRLSAPPILLTDFLVPRLVPLLRRYPEIELETIGEMRGADLARGEVDIAMRMVEPTSPQLVVRRLGDVSYALFASEVWHTLAEAELAFIGFDERSRHSQHAWLRRQVGVRRYALRTNDLRAMYHAAQSGLGIALLPRFLVRPADGLRALPIESDALTCPIYLVMHADVRRSPRVRAVADFLVELFQSHGHEL
jgi:DNA-binding transcriptional LysR family regulator